jgi:DNA repair exonuclease SbcCD nuclease subunit
MYTLISDLHYHNWSAFSTTLPSGINSRLQIIMDETLRAAKHAKDSGSNHLLLAGDTFHVRGKLAPSVYNPILGMFKYITEEMGVKVYAIPGNHDLESETSDSLGNGADGLHTVGVVMINQITFISDLRVVMIPYIKDMDDLKKAITDNANPGCDLIIHAPVDGVIPGLPDHGLTAEWLGDQGYKRVFSGHYHNHVDFGNGVYSIGATTHQTWGDTNSRAGFLAVTGGVEYHASHAPEFFTLNEETDPEEVPLLVDGNYVRVTMQIDKESQVEEMRQFLMDSGALGVVINRLKKTSTVGRTGATVKSGASLFESLGEFIKAKKHKREGDLTKLCAEILNEAEMV